LSRLSSPDPITAVRNREANHTGSVIYSTRLSSLTGRTTYGMPAGCGNLTPCGYSVIRACACGDMTGRPQNCTGLGLEQNWNFKKQDGSGWDSWMTLLA
jgi:hypothetical protein